MSFNLNDSPHHFLILNSIFKNYNTLDKIIKFTKLEKENVETIIEELTIQKLIIQHEKKNLFFGKKKYYDLTETGLKILNAKNQELEEKMRQAQQWYSQDDHEHTQSFIEGNREWLPLMVMSGIMDVVFFTSLMSFTGISLNPMESFLFGNNATVTSDNSNIDDNISNTDMPTGDLNDYDFNGGGFDSF